MHLLFLIAIFASPPNVATTKTIVSEAIQPQVAIDGDGNIRKISVSLSTDKGRTFIP